MRLETEPDIQAFKTPLLDLRYLAMNLWHPPLDKPEVRDAIRYAIDYDGIIEYILREPAQNSNHYTQGVLGHNPAMPYQRYSKSETTSGRRRLCQWFSEVKLASLNFSPWLDTALKIKTDLAKVE